MSYAENDAMRTCFRLRAHLELQVRRRGNLPVSSAHSEIHLNGVAELVPQIGKAYNFSDREMLLGNFVAEFHDIVRSGGENLGNQDEAESAGKAAGILLELNSAGKFLTTQEERDAVSFAILNHGTSPPYFNDPDRREEKPVNLADILHTIIYIADGLQKLGPQLIHRRSAFVGGERRGVGDLKDMRYKANPITAAQAVLLESAVRLGWKHQEGLYPDRVKSSIAPAFAIQRDWVCGILAGYGLMMDGWTNLLWNARNFQGQNIFELSKLSNFPRDEEEIKTVLAQRGMISDIEIMYALTDPDLMISAISAVEYFSSHWQEDAITTIRAWNPTGEHAKIWKEGM